MSLDILYRPLYDKIKSETMFWLTISPEHCDLPLHKRIRAFHDWLSDCFLPLCENYILVYELANERLHCHVVFSKLILDNKQEIYRRNIRFNSFINSLGSHKDRKMPLFIKKKCQWKLYVGEPEKKIEYLFKDCKSFINDYGLYPVYDSDCIRSEAMQSFFTCADDHHGD